MTVEVPQDGNQIDIPGVRNHESSRQFVRRSSPLQGDSLPGDLASLWTVNPHHLDLFSKLSIAVWPIENFVSPLLWFPKMSPRFNSYGLSFNGIGQSNNLRLINRHQRSLDYPTSIWVSGIAPGKRLVRDAQLPLVLARVCQPAPSFLSFERGASHLGLKYCHPVDMQSYAKQEIRKKVVSTTNLIPWRVTRERHVHSYCAPYHKYTSTVQRESMEHIWLTHWWQSIISSLQGQVLPQIRVSVYVWRSMLGCNVLLKPITQKGMITQFSELHGLLHINNYNQEENLIKYQCKKSCATLNLICILLYKCSCNILAVLSIRWRQDYLMPQTWASCWVSGTIHSPHSWDWACCWPLNPSTMWLYCFRKFLDSISAALLSAQPTQLSASHYGTRFPAKKKKVIFFIWFNITWTIWYKCSYKTEE